MVSNTRKLARNSITSLIYQFVLVVSGFILPRIIMGHYGSLTYGLVSSVSQFLGLITFCELGIGAVIQSSLYKPLVENDLLTVSRVFVSSQKFFNKITIIIVCYIIALIIGYPLFVDSSFDFLLTTGLIIAISITYIFQYLFGITNQLLLDADQEVSVEVLPQIIATIIATGLSILLIELDFSIVQVKAVSALVYIVRPVYLSWYVKRHYQIDRKVTYTEEPIKQKWNGIAQHISTVVLRNTATICLSLFGNLIFVAIYSVYSMVVKAFSQAIESISISLTSFLGIKIAESDLEESNKAFGFVEFIYHNLMTLLFSLMAILIVPFVRVYTAGIDDANYVQPLFAILMVSGYYIANLRIPYHVVIKAAGHYKQTQTSAIIEASLNVIVTLVLIKLSPLLAVSVGFLTAMIYRTVYYIWYLRDNILYRQVKTFLKYCVTDLLLIAIIVAASLLFSKYTVNNYFTWIIYALALTTLSVILDIFLCCLFYRAYLRSIWSFFKNRIINK